MSRGWVTFSGKRFRILDPREEDMCIEDVAHHLAYQCRYNGATEPFFSIAEHCVMGSYIIDPKYGYDFLMHDCAEAWCGDMIRPMKHETDLQPIFTAIEDAIFAVAAVKFDVSDPVPLAVKELDVAMFKIEQRQLFPNHPNPEEFDQEFHKGFKLPCWSMDRAEREFLARFRYLSSSAFIARGELRY